MTLDRRSWLKGLGVTLGGGFLAACDRFTRAPSTVRFLGAAESLTQAAQRAIGANALAREFRPQDISPNFRANGTLMPIGEAYRSHVASDFADWRLVIDGMVQQPLSLSLAEVRALPSRTQITRHDCVEGWSSIGQWTGARMSALLQRAGAQPAARYVVLHCADSYDARNPEASRYYESIDMVDAMHEQTILAYAMNGQSLPVQHGAPLRLRAERHLGYKQAKYVMRLQLTDRLDNIHGGRGGFWEDRDYERYAGI
jgi:DMSO/TMAO reductase YedYZ molybdopterin-dependent catalytic subunit